MVTGICFQTFSGVPANVSTSLHIGQLHWCIPDTAMYAALCHYNHYHDDLRVPV
jgi:hypothetical protein